MNNWKLRFSVIWLGQAVSFFTSAILQMALIWHLAITTNSALVLSLASIAGFLPMAVLGSFAGAFVDRWNRKLVMIGADLYIALVSLALAIYALIAVPPLWFIMTVLFMRSVGTAFHSPAISSVTPLIVPESHLTKCAGYTQSLQTIGLIAGTSVAAVLYPLWGISGMIALDVVGAVVASLAVAFVKIPSTPKGADRQRAADGSNEKSPGLIFEIADAYRILKKHRGLFSLLWIGAVFIFLLSPINALFPLMSMDYFKGTTTQAAIAEITFSVGMIVGGVLLGTWGGFKNRGITIGAAIALMGITVGVSGVLPANGFYVFAVLSFLMGLSAPLYNGPQTALLQEKISPEYLGRIFGFYGSLMSFALLLGPAVTGVFADMLGVNVWFLICGAIMSVLAIITILTPSVRNI